MPNGAASNGSETWLDRMLVSLRLKPGNTIRDDLRDALSEGADGDHDFTPEERAMLANILRLREVRVEDVMVPRGDVHGVERDTTLGELLALFEEHGHSRMPVFRDSLDDPLGMVHIKDLVLHLTRLARKRRSKNAEAEGQPEELDMGRIALSGTLAEARIMRRVLFVPPSMLAVDLMGRMQATRTQMALVIDEYGGTDGLVSLEDIVEEVVGDIEDEHDDDEDALVVSRAEGVWSADARAELSDLREVMAETGDRIDLSTWEDEVDTLGGLVFTLAGHIPVRGEVVAGVPGYEFRVVEADPRRVRRLQIVARDRRTAKRRRGRDGGRDGARDARAPPGGSVTAAAVTAPPADANAAAGATTATTATPSPGKRKASSG